MIVIKQNEELQSMKKACRLAAQALELAGKAVKPGVTTLKINELVENFLNQKGAKASFLNYGGFPSSICVSTNNEVIHGIPSSSRVLQEGDVVSIDVGAFYEGFHGDNAATFAVGVIDTRIKELLAVTQKSLMLGINAAKQGARIGSISSVIQNHVENSGFSIVKDYVGHGIGRALHEDPEVPNYGKQDHGIRLVEGITLAIEPMVNAGKAEVKTLADGWTVLTCDGSISAHFEHTIAITEHGPEVLTLC